MGEMSSMIGGMFNATKGPEDPGIQASAAAASPGGYTPTARAGAMDINENPEAASVFPAPAQSAAKPGPDVWDKVGAGLNQANQYATTLRGLQSDLSRGPGASPLAARPTGAAAAYQPTARAGAGGLRLSDILARR